MKSKTKGSKTSSREQPFPNEILPRGKIEKQKGAPLFVSVRWDTLLDEIRSFPFSPIFFVSLFFKIVATVYFARFLERSTSIGYANMSYVYKI